MKKGKLAALALLSYLVAGTASASLIGTEIGVDYINDGNPAGNASTTVTVQAGSGDAFQFGFSGIYGFTIDIEESYISMLCTGGFCNTTPDLGPVHYIFSGLDWGGSAYLGGVSLDGSSNCPLCSASVSLLSPTSFELLMPNLANPAPNDTLLINLQAVSVSEPSSLALFLIGAGLAGSGFTRKRKKV